MTGPIRRRPKPPQPGAETPRERTDGRAGGRGRPVAASSGPLTWPRPGSRGGTREVHRGKTNCQTEWLLLLDAAAVALWGRGRGEGSAAELYGVSAIYGNTFILKSISRLSQTKSKKASHTDREVTCNYVLSHVYVPEVRDRKIIFIQMKYRKYYLRNAGLSSVTQSTSDFQNFTFIHFCNDPKFFERFCT